MDGHPHQYNPATDLCEADGCERMRPDWLDPSAIAASPAAPGGWSGPSLNNLNTFTVGPVKYVVILVAIVAAAHIGGRAWGNQIAAEPDDGGRDIPVNVSVR